MSIETTPTTFTPREGAYLLGPAVDAVARLVAEYPTLPAPYVVLHAPSQKVFLQWQDPAHFEVWREALGIDSAEVELKAGAGSSWLAVEGVVPSSAGEVPVGLTGHGLSGLRERGFEVEGAGAFGEQVAA